MKKGFTLVELTVIIIVIIVISIIMYPMYSQPPGRERARQTTCLSNQKQIALAMLLYLEENKEIFPEINDDIFSTLGLSGKVLFCPNTTGQCYVVNARLSNLELKQIEDPESVWLTADAARGATGPVGYGASDMDPRHAGGIIASFVDGHAAYHKRISDVTTDVRLKMKSVPSGTIFDKNGINQGFKYMPLADERDNLIIELPADSKNTPNISCTVHINGLKILSKLEKGETVRMIVDLYTGGFLEEYADTHFGSIHEEMLINTYFDKEFAAEDFINITTFLIGVTVNSADLKFKEKYKKIVLYPVISFYTSKTSDDIKIDSVDIIKIEN